MDLGTITTVIESVNKAIEIYHKIADKPEQIRRIGRRMERLEALLNHLESLLKNQKKKALARLRSAQTQEVLEILDDIKADSAKVQVLFDKWYNDIGPFGFQLRFKTLAQAYFALGSNSDKLAALGEDLEMHRQDMRDYLQLMGAEGINRLLLNGGGGGGGDSNDNVPAQQDKLAPGAALSRRPSDASRAPRHDIKILFVDPHNVSRSMVAEGYMKLLKAWTLENKSDWRVSVIHSAGFFCQNRSEVSDVLEKLKYRKPSYKLDATTVGQSPDKVALEALFDNKTLKYPFKEKVHGEMTKRKSRGLWKAIFKTYDFIIVFTGREQDNLLRLKRALIEAESRNAIVARGKGRILHLGAYLSDGVPTEIVAPQRKPDGSASRPEWNSKVGQIKLAIRSFLMQEMDWKRPKEP